MKINSKIIFKKITTWTLIICTFASLVICNSTITKPSFVTAAPVNQLPTDASDDLYEEKPSTTEIIRFDNNKKTVTISNSTQLRENAWYYSTLDDTEKKIYNTLLSLYGFDMNTGRCNAESINLQSSSFFTYTNVKNALHAMLYDRPEIFWINDFNISEIQYINGIYLTTMEVRKQYNPIIYNADALEFKGHYENALAKIRKKAKNKYFEQIISIISEQIEEFASYRRSSYIINSQTANETRSVGYFMAHKEGGCVSYSKCFQLLCQGLGIECTVVSGRYQKNNSLVEHMWCLVKADDEKWYQIEPQDRFATLDGLYDKTNEGYVIDNGTYSAEDNPNQCNISIAYYAVPPLSLLGYEEVHKESIFQRTCTRNGSIEYTTYKDNGKRYAKAINVDDRLTTQLKKVTIPKYITFKGEKIEVRLINSYTFIECNKLNQITIKGNNVSFKKEAFYGMSNKTAKKLVIKVPKKTAKKYKKKLRKKNVLFKGTIKSK